MRVLFFGDSITQGFFDSQGGWVERLIKEFHAEGRKNPRSNWPAGFNLGVSGDTAKRVAARIDSEISARRLKNEELVIVLAVGINDAALFSGRVITDEQDFQRTYGQIIDTASKYTSKIICVGLSAVNESAGDGGIAHSNNRINLFEDCIKQLCIIRKLTFVPLFDEFSKKLESRADLLADGLHPNDSGHQFIYQKLKPAVNNFFPS